MYFVGNIILLFISHSMKERASALEIKGLNRALHEAYSYGRHRRAVLGNIEIETVVILDAEYVADMRARGHSTNQSLIELMNLKFSGVQAEWGRSSVLNYDVAIAIKEIVIWESNPSWYTPSTVLNNALLSVCSGANTNGLWTSFDHIHLFTGRTGTDVAGVSYTGLVCQAGRKCSVSSNTRIDEYVITAHEIGHIVGFGHDVDVGCPNPYDGIMGSKTAGWSSCSVGTLNYMIQNEASVSCVQSVNVPTANVLILQKAWPGMLYTPDDICEFKHGAGYRLKSSATSCWGDMCMNLDPSSMYYGVSYRELTPTDGKYCGDQMVCSSQIVNSSYQCISTIATGLDQSLFTPVIGGWSAWGPMTSCSRTCGTGVQYRQRFCNNPKPKNSAWCAGEEFDAQTCNTEPCISDDPSVDGLIKQRAGETCVKWKANNLYGVTRKLSANYLNTGNKFSASGDGQCEVRCDTVAGYLAGGGERHGVMPDGTPCAHVSLTSFEETNNLPRLTGMSGKCVQGKCHLFGCNGLSGTVSKDECGVCGGSNSTCQFINGIYSTILAANVRGTVAVLPARASLIQFYFQYITMTYNFLEVRTKDGDIAVVKYTDLDTMNNPISFAGTHWYLRATKQFLYAQGPTNQEVIIKLYNFKGNNNTGVTYGYTFPTASEMAACSGTCANGGSWNLATCSCHCATGFYGINCTSTCSKFCLNSQPHDANCNCNCQGHTYGTICNCRYPFHGIDCQDCKINSCQNGGTFNATGCRCSCPPGYGSLDCSTPCEDASGDTPTCLTKVASGQCESKNEVMERDCYKSCGLCSLATTTSAPSTLSTTPTTPPTTEAPTTSSTTAAPTTQSTTKAPTTTEATTAPSTTEAPTTQSLTQAPTTLYTTEAPTTPSTTEAPTTPSTTEAPTTPSITEAPTTPSTTEATTTPSTTEAPTTPSTTEAPTTPFTTEAPTTPSTTEAPTTPSTTEAPTTPSTTEAPTTPATTEAPTTPSTTEAPTTPSTTEAPTTPSTTEAPTTPSTTEAPTTPSTTEAPTTPSTTEAPTTPSPTKAPTTPYTTEAPRISSTTEAPTTPSTTEAPTTPSTTEAPTTLSTTEAPTTQSLTQAPTTPYTTEAPTTPSTTEAPTTPSTTEAPTTPSTTEAPTTPSTTEAPTTLSTTEAPTTQSLTQAPTTPYTTEAPTRPSTTEAPTTPSTTEAPTTPSTTEAPTTPSTTEAPTTPSTTEAPTTPSTTEAPTTLSTTEAPTTQSLTQAPTTPYTTEAPTTPSTTEAPTTPSTTEAPTTPSTTEAPTTPSTTEAPTTPSTTEAPTTPSTTETPTTPSTTEAPTTPSTTEAPTTPSTTEAPTPPSTTPASTILQTISTLTTLSRGDEKGQPTPTKRPGPTPERPGQKTKENEPASTQQSSDVDSGRSD